jgi:hypothetical protein
MHPTKTPTTDSVIRRLAPQRTPDQPADYSKTKGKRFGIGIWRFWGMIFAANESLAKAKKMTDAEIMRQFIAEFSSSQLAADLREGNCTVNKYRNLYNAGRLTRGIPPTVQSKRYSITGEVLNGRTGNPLKVKRA